MTIHEAKILRIIAALENYGPTRAKEVLSGETLDDLQWDEAERRWEKAGSKRSPYHQ